MRDHVKPLLRDYDSEPVDASAAIDELVNYAISLRDDVLRDPAGRRMPLYALMLLEALDDKHVGPTVIHSTFDRYEMRRTEIDAMIRKLGEQSYMNANEK